jgi:transposase InsO family protein
MKWISDHAEKFKVLRMTDLLEVSKSGYYRQLKRTPSKRSQENSFLLTKVKEVFEQGRKCYGSPRITASLRNEGYVVGQNRIARLMKDNHLRAKMKRKRVNTTDSNHSRPIAENTLNRQFQVLEPNRVWAGDITYIPTREGWLYLSVVLDLNSRKVVGWSMAQTMETGLILGAVNMALQRRKTAPGLLFHSDRGSQYASQAFQDHLKGYGMSQSMSRKGNCWDNACSESFFGTLKLECCDRVFTTRKEASSVIFEYIEVFYNRQRLHSSLGYLSPEQFEQQSVA